MTKCLVVGSGLMGQAHLKVGQSLLGDNVACFAPSSRNQKAIESMGVSFFSGSLSSAIESFAPTHFIVAVPVENLAFASSQLVEMGAKNILVEKPAFLNLTEAKHLLSNATKRSARIAVAYNRRFFSSVQTARKMIHEGRETILNVAFEFTEWSHKIKDSTASAATKKLWVLANSLHVIDLAFSPVGLPDEGKSLFTRSGSLEWHPSASNMVGAGHTKNGQTFSCFANWTSPGRWGVEWMTEKNRYIFRPLEALKIQKLGSVSVEDVPLDLTLDNEFKPGLYQQNKAFLADEELVSLEYGIALGELAKSIAGYDI